MHVCNPRACSCRADDVLHPPLCRSLTLFYGKIRLNRSNHVYLKYIREVYLRLSRMFVAARARRECRPVKGRSSVRCPSTRRAAEEGIRESRTARRQSHDRNPGARCRVGESRELVPVFPPETRNNPFPSFSLSPLLPSPSSSLFLPFSLFSVPRHDRGLTWPREFVPLLLRV